MTTDLASNAKVACSPERSSASLMTLGEVSAFLPRKNGKRVSIPCLWRWCVHGCRGVKLEHLRLGRQLFVTPEAVLAFGAAMAKLGPAERRRRRGTTTRRRTRTEDQRMGQVAAADAYCKSKGF